MQEAQELKHEEPAISYNDALHVAEHFKPDLTAEGKRELADHFRRNPAQYRAALEQTRRTVSQGIQAQLDTLSSLLDEAKEADNAAWQPADPQQYYTPAETRALKRYELLDATIGRLTGTSKAERFRTLLHGAVRERYQTRVLDRLGDGVRTLKRGAEGMEQLHDTTERDLEARLDNVRDQRMNIAIYDARLEEIPGKLEAAYAELQDCPGDGAELRERIRGLKQDQRAYVLAVQEATNKVLLDKQGVAHIARYRKTMRQQADGVARFATELQFVHDSIRLHTSEPYDGMSPDTLLELNKLHEEAKGILKGLLGADERRASALSDALPSRFYNPQEALGASLGTDLRADAEYTDARKQEAIAFADEINDLHYL